MTTWSCRESPQRVIANFKDSPIVCLKGINDELRMLYVFEQRFGEQSKRHGKIDKMMLQHRQFKNARRWLQLKSEVL